MLISSKKSIVLPGDIVAVSEEYFPGKNVYEESGVIRASITGRVIKDNLKREISVEPCALAKNISVGDYIIGQVESVQTNFAVVRIYYSNGRPIDKGFSGLLMFKTPIERQGLKKVYVKLGDIVYAKVVSTINAIIQLSLDEEVTGVIFATCSVCGKPLTRIGNRAKCEECGNVEERKFASDTTHILSQL